MPQPILEAEETGSPNAGDPRWQLVERIVASQVFAKSDRLRTFLSHICELSLNGQEDEINEVNIGIHLFGRPDFDPSVDGIVRSHASRMRQRLEQYFEEAGASETIRLTVPKGSYVPVWETVAAVRKPEPEQPHFAASLSPPQAPAHPQRPKRTVWVLSAALSLASSTSVVLLLVLLHRPGVPASPTLQNPLWAMLFGHERVTTIVCSDTSVAVEQDLTGKQVNLTEYLNGSYRISSPAPTGTTQEVLRDLVARRYTAVADVGIVSRFFKLPGIAPDRIQFRYARDLRADVIKDGSTVLIGSAYSSFDRVCLQQSLGRPV